MSRSRLYSELMLSTVRSDDLLKKLHKEHTTLLEYIQTHKGICAQEEEGDTSLADVIIRWLESERIANSQPLLCDYCKQPTSDPWHGSGVVDGVVKKHLHACDECRGKLPKPEGTKYAWLNIAGTEDGGFSNTWVERLSNAENLTKDALEYMEANPEARSFKLLEYRCLTDKHFSLSRTMKLK